MKLSLIVARSRNNVIGKGGGLPWDRIPEDMANFRRLTMGKPCIMGRNTFDSLPEPLEGRRNIVLSRGRSLTEREFNGPWNIAIVRTPVEAIVEAFDAHGTDEAFVIGGAEVYGLFYNLCSDAYVTTVQRDVDGDVRFPYAVAGVRAWNLVESRPLADDATFSHYTRA